MEQQNAAQRLGIVGIIISDRRSSAKKVNEILGRYGDSIVARTGLFYAGRGVHIISVFVDLSTNDLGALTGKLGMVPGVQVKSFLF
jgi:putative iron-only hydrogenase system regulator